MDITLTDLEDAINYWRSLRPSSGEEHALSPEVNTLATVYAMMIVRREKTVDFESMGAKAGALFDAWRKQRA